MFKAHLQGDINNPIGFVEYQLQGCPFQARLLDEPVQGNSRTTEKQAVKMKPGHATHIADFSKT